MTILEFKRELEYRKSNFTMLLDFNLESPIRMKYAIEGTLEYLKPIKYEGELKKRVKRAIQFLNLAYINIDIFSKNLKTDFSSSNDLAAKHIDESFWYQEVIGMSESAMSIIIDFIDDNE